MFLRSLLSPRSRARHRARCRRAGSPPGARRLALEPLEVRDLLSVTELVSGVGGAFGNNTSISGEFALNADGRYAVFQSDASNLVTGDTNGCADVFVKDMQTGAMTRASTDSSGNQGNNHSLYAAAISADGRYVAFESPASNLVPGDTNGRQDVFVKDLQTGTTTLVSCDPGGHVGDLGSGDPSISVDGRYVAFQSGAHTLLPGDNGWSGIFVRDVQRGTTGLVSSDSGGNQGTGQALVRRRSAPTDASSPSAARPQTSCRAIQMASTTFL